jgi:hypothetical protein
MKNLEKREGYLNRHLNPLPVDNVYPIEFISNDVDGEHTYKGLWYPSLPDKYTEENKPAKGFLGHIRITEPYNIGFNAWEQNDSEFVYYKILKEWK